MALPRIIKNPGAKSIPKLKKKGYKKAGPKYGKNVFVAPKPKAATTAAATPTGPYAEYADYPWAQQQLKQLDRDQAFHQTYATDKVLPWASQALTNLTGVDPNQPGINPVMQQQYLANVQGNVGGALNAAAAAGQAPNIAATTPGGIMASPTQYMSNAASEGARGMASSYLQSAQLQSALNTIQPNLMSQSYIMQLSDYAKGLPAVYAEKRSELRSNIDKFISDAQQEAAQQAETARHNQVTESISAMNAQTNAAIQFGNLGISAGKLAADTTPATAPDAASIPVGYVSTPDGKGGYKVVRDPTYVNPSSSSSSSSGGGGNKPLTASQISSMNGKWKGAKNKPPKLGAGWKQPVWDPGTKAWYAKRAAGSGGTTKTAKVLPGSDLQKKLVSLYKPGGTGGWEERYQNDPKGAGTEMARWVRENKVSFTTGGKVDVTKLKQVLARIGGRPAAEALSILTRGYMTADGRWK